MEIAVSTLERLYFEHQQRVRWIMHARGIEPSAIDDLVHESFMTIHRRWPDRDRSVPVATWVTGVARNVAFSHRRTEARRRRRLEDLPAPQADAAPDEVVARQEAWTKLHAFTRSLSPKLREVFVLADVGGMPVHEIAETCRVPLATLHSRLRLARQRFAAHFGSHGDAEARSALLRRAAAEHTPSPQARRRSLAVLVAASKVTAASTTVTAWVIVSVVVGVAAIVAASPLLDEASERPTIAAAPQRASEATEPDATAPSDAPRPATPAAIAPTVTTTADEPGTPRPRTAALSSRVAAHRGTVATSKQTSRAADADAATPDPLAAHVAALERARSLIETGRATQALAVLDAVETQVTSLARDHHRVTLQAACAAKLVGRARRAQQELAALGLAVDATPCPAEEGEPHE